MQFRSQLFSIGPVHVHYKNIVIKEAPLDFADVTQTDNVLHMHRCLSEYLTSFDLSTCRTKCGEKMVTLDLFAYNY